MTRILLIIWLSLELILSSAGQESADISEAVVQSTFLIKDERSPFSGSGFVVYKVQTNGVASVFVTANHVLTNFVGENAIIMLRRSIGQSQWELAPLTNRIRQGTNILYVRHPRLDVAAFYIALPGKCIDKRLGEQLLMDETAIRNAGLGPGTEVLNVGFPFGIASGPEQFGFLRSGRIASYPILPVAARNTFELAITAFGGNSGGPVYISNHVKPGTENNLPTPRYLGIVGVLTTSRMLIQNLETVDETITRKTQLGFAGVIHAHFIKETIELLPKHW